VKLLELRVRVRTAEVKMDIREDSRRDDMQENLAGGTEREQSPGQKMV
jgi:hypothetical protein